MASTYTPGGIELIADGEQSNTWGQTTNTNWQLTEEMVAGVVSISLTGLSTYTLTTADGVTSNGRHAVVKFTGSPSSTVTVTVSPNDFQKIYFIDNATDEDLTLTQGSGANVTVPAGFKKIVYCDGAGAGAAITDVTDNLSLSGTVDASTFKIDGTEVTATATELNTLDGITSTVNELNILDGVTASTAELNILDGVTASTSELNILDGVTATTAEINKLDGFTGSATDLNYAKDLRATGVTTTEFDKLDGLTASTAELNKLDGFTGSATDLNYAKDLRATGVTTTEFDKLDGLTASTSELNILDGVTASTSELNILDGVTASTSELNILDGVTASTAEINKLDGFTGTATDLNYAKDLRATGVTTTEFDYLDGVTGNIQTQLNAKQNASNALTTSTSFGGDVSGAYNAIVVKDDSHNHVISNVDGLQTALDGKVPTGRAISAGGGLTGGGNLTANRTISHADTSSQGNVNTSGTTVIDSINLDGYGHVTSMATRDMAGSIRSAIGGTTFSSVGSYMLLRAVAGGPFLYNATYTGNNLSPASASGEPDISGGLIVIIGGSWRCAGRSDAGNLTTASRANETTLWVRYA